MTSPYSSPALLAMLFTLTLASARASQVMTEAGPVEGTLENGIHVFRGVPYAAPPLGELRWQPPRPAPHWDGVRPADHFGPRAMQPRVFADMVFRDTGPSEDCLYLNVWTPALDAAPKLPVLVWIYGGGFAGGSSSEPRQDGRNLAGKGVVVVSMNYRLGIFGFFSHPELTRESAQHASGNYGLLDQAAALAWVQRNIAAFGGDPRRVTIFGESAGSFSVSALMASPLSRDLMHGAIGESGAFFGETLRASSLEQSEKNGLKFAQAAKARSLADLRALPAAELQKLATANGEPHFGPNVDGWFLPRPVSAIFGAGEQARVPLLAGWNANEGGMPADHRMTADDFADQAWLHYGDDLDNFLAVYPAATDATAREAAAAWAGDQFIAYGTWKWIELHRLTGGQPVYRYRFDHALPQPAGTPSRGAPHAGEIEYVFDNLASRNLPFGDADRRLADQMSSYWTNFAKALNPNGDGLPTWPTYDPKTGFEVMHLAVPPKAAPDEHRKRYQFLDAHGPDADPAQ